MWRGGTKSAVVVRGPERDGRGAQIRPDELHRVVQGGDRHGGGERHARAREAERQRGSSYTPKFAIETGTVIPMFKSANASTSWGGVSADPMEVHSTPSATSSASHAPRLKPRAERTCAGRVSATSPCISSRRIRLSQRRERGQIQATPSSSSPAPPTRPTVPACGRSTPAPISPVSPARPATAHRSTSDPASTILSARIAPVAVDRLRGAASFAARWTRTTLSASPARAGVNRLTHSPRVNACAVRAGVSATWRGRITQRRNACSPS